MATSRQTDTWKGVRMGYASATHAPTRSSSMPADPTRRSVQRVQATETDRPAAVGREAGLGLGGL